MNDNSLLLLRVINNEVDIIYSLFLIMRGSSLFDYYNVQLQYLYSYIFILYRLNPQFSYEFLIMPLPQIYIFLSQRITQYKVNKYIIFIPHRYVFNKEFLALNIAWIY